MLSTPRKQFSTGSRASLTSRPGSPATPQQLGSSTAAASAIANNLGRVQLSDRKHQQRGKAGGIHIRSPVQYRFDVVQSDFTLTGTGPPVSPRRSSSAAALRNRPHKSDRFISADAKGSTAHVDAEAARRAEEEQRDYTRSVAEACGLAINTRILSFKPEAPENRRAVALQSQYNRPLKPAAAAASERRKISTTPERVLDAPGLVDDYYLNLLDWSASNQVAIGLDQAVYIWNANTGAVSSLMETSEDTYVSSLRWSRDGSYLSVGVGDGGVQIWDIATASKLRSMQGHTARVGVMSWDRHILSSGSRDGAIHNHDVRIREHKVSEFLEHRAEVCGLDWRADGSQLASGGNDNVVCIWDARSAVPKFCKTNHTAAVKALSWCPWQVNLLCTGGGSADRKIHWWNTTNGARVQSVDTGSQVTSLRWSQAHKEVVSTHGWPDNQLSVWSYGSTKIQKQIDIPAHESRVLHSSLSPDGQTLATAAADENLKFFKIWAREKKPQPAASAVGSRPGKEEFEKCMMIR